MFTGCLPSATAPTPPRWCKMCRKPPTGIKRLPQEVLNLRQHFGLAPDDLLLLYQGGLNPERGLEECIQAVAMLPKTFKLVLIGDGRLKGYLEELVNHLQLEDRVFFFGQVPSNSSCGTPARPMLALWCIKTPP